MPVQFDEFDSTDEEWTIREGSNAHRILSFLLAEPEKGFTPSEIAEATGMPEGSVGPTLQRLAERDLVRHKRPYWSAARDDRIAAYEAMLASMEALADDAEGWDEVDPDRHRVAEDALAEWRAGRDGGDEA